MFVSVLPESVCVYHMEGLITWKTTTENEERVSVCVTPLVIVGLRKLVSLVAFFFLFFSSVESNMCSCAHAYSGLPFPQLCLVK